MLFNKTRTVVFRQRKSSRSYTDKPIEKDKKEVLGKFFSNK